MVDSVDRRILFELERNARISDVKLAKLTKKSKDTIRYRIRKLEENNIITEYKTWIDFTKLKYRTVTIYLKTKNIAQSIHKLKQESISDPRTYWIGLGYGFWNIGITYFVKTNEEILKIKQQLQERFGDIIVQTDIVFLTNLGIQEKKFLKKTTAGLTFFTEKTVHEEIDKLSKQILSQLYSNARRSLAKIAHELNTSVDKVKSRVKSLVKKGIIARFSARINYNKLGFEYYKTHIYLKNKKAFQKIYSYIENTTDMINVVKQIAPWDIEIVQFNTNFQEYTASIARFNKEFQDDIEKTEFSAMYEDILYPCDEMLE